MKKLGVERDIFDENQLNLLFTFKHPVCASIFPSFHVEIQFCFYEAHETKPDKSDSKTSF